MASKDIPSTAFVTGAAGAIGNAIVRSLLDADYRVACNDIADLPIALEVDWIQGDILAEGARAAVTEAHTRLGRLDLLVHCAGGADPRPFLELSDSEWDHTLDLNSSAAFRICQAAARIMAAQNAGRIIVITSLCARLAWKNFAHYCAAKAATEMLCKAIAVELAPLGIVVNAIAPGTIDTPLTDRVGLDELEHQRLLHRTPLGRMGRPEEIAAVALWLATAPTFLTGETVVIDGGYSVEGSP